MIRHYRTLAASGALITALALAGCAASDGDGMNGMDGGSDAGSGSSDSSSTSAANTADIAFTIMMIPHHEQAIEMSDMLLAKTGVDRRVVSLAEQITAAQQPEIDLMEGWLDDWGQDMGGMDHGGHGGSGMMSDDDMADLDAAAGPEASRLFLEQMIEHHQGAIDMSQDEATDGENADAVDLAGRIVETQTAEIATMEEILATL